jgi:hypothetical protein
MIVAVVAIMIFLGFSTGLLKIKFEKNEYVDVKYFCSELNKTKISKEDLKTILYGFLTSQCNYFEFELKQSIGINELEEIAKEIDKNVVVAPKNNCELPITATKTIFVCCSAQLKPEKPINISKRKIINSDVLICQGE